MSIHIEIGKPTIDPAYVERREMQASQEAEMTVLEAKIKNAESKEVKYSVGSGVTFFAAIYAWAFDADLVAVVSLASSTYMAGKAGENYVAQRILKKLSDTTSKLHSASRLVVDLSEGQQLLREENQRRYQDPMNATENPFAERNYEMPVSIPEKKDVSQMEVPGTIAPIKDRYSGNGGMKKFSV